MTPSLANSCACIERIQLFEGKEQKEEYTLLPGQGILFYKFGKPIIDDKFKIFKKAQSAFKHDLMEIFSIHDEQDGLLLSPSLDHKHANIAYIDPQSKKIKLSASLIRKDNKIKYIGHLRKN